MFANANFGYSQVGSKCMRWKASGNNHKQTAHSVMKNRVRTVHLSPITFCRYCVAFDFEAKMLVHRYWQCLGINLDEVAASGTKSSWGIQADSVRTTAAVCATADVSAVLGLFSACHLIGWRKVLRAGVMAFNCLSGGAGVLVTLVGLMLRVDQVRRHRGHELESSYT